MKTINRFQSAIGTAWCSFWHDDIYWPVNGSYKCRTCLRVYPVRWSNCPDPPQQLRKGASTSLVTAASEG
jgi:hypothetical protein